MMMIPSDDELLWQNFKKNAVSFVLQIGALRRRMWSHCRSSYGLITVISTSGVYQSHYGKLRVNIEVDTRVLDYVAPAFYLYIYIFFSDYNFFSRSTLSGPCAPSPLIVSRSGISKWTAWPRSWLWPLWRSVSRGCTRRTRPTRTICRNRVFAVGSPFAHRWYVLFCFYPANVHSHDMYVLNSPDYVQLNRSVSLRATELADVISSMFGFTVSNGVSVLCVRTFVWRIKFGVLTHHVG